MNKLVILLWTFTKKPSSNDLHLQKWNYCNQRKHHFCIIYSLELHNIKKPLCNLWYLQMHYVPFRISIHQNHTLWPSKLLKQVWCCNLNRFHFFYSHLIHCSIKCHNEFFVGIDGWYLVVLKDFLYWYCPFVLTFLEKWSNIFWELGFIWY